MAKRAPDWIRDQIDAANAEQQSRYAQAVKSPEWDQERAGGSIARRIAEEVLALLPTATGCKHVQSPTPVYVQAHNPSHLMCLMCLAKSMAKTKGTDEDCRCDGCREVFDTLAPGIANLGPLMVMLGLCPSCELLDRASQ